MLNVHSLRLRSFEQKSWFNILCSFFFCFSLPLLRISNWRWRVGFWLWGLLNLILFCLLVPTVSAWPTLTALKLDASVRPAASLSDCTFITGYAWVHLFEPDSCPQIKITCLYFISVFFGRLGLRKAPTHNVMHSDAKLDRVYLSFLGFGGRQV